MKNFTSVQEALDYAVLKIVEQGGQCLSGDGGCAYGNGEGQHCAVGWLLDHDDEKLMGFSGAVGDIIEEYQDRVPEIITNNVGVFCILQDFHDTKLKSSRADRVDSIKKMGYNTSAPQWQQWIDMGV